MLVLTRKISESVMIGDGIQVIVLGLKGDNVVLGFNAPRIVPVHREEVYLRNKIFNLKDKKSLIVDEVLKSNTRKKIRDFISAIRHRME